MWWRRVSCRRWAGLAAAAAVLGLLIGPGATDARAVSARAAASSPGAFSQNEQISRLNLVDGVVQAVDQRTFSVTVAQTRDLRERQEINVSWTGAHPTGGIVTDPNSPLAAQQEYPVVQMMCRGTPSQISPSTCWTETPPERFESSNSFNFPPYRLDVYASAADRAAQVGVPTPLPAACNGTQGGIQHWVPFVAASGQVYSGGPNGCAGLPPEAVNAENSLQPGNTTYGLSDLKGTGADKFVITTNESNASLGCSNTVPCALVIIPIMGISCDAAGDSLPPADRPTPAAVRAEAFAQCSQTGNYLPGQLSSGFQNAESLAVSGELWWSASNWRNRITVPLTFAPPANECALVSSSTPVPIYGSYLLLQATQQWAPHFCLNKKLFSLQHVQTSEPEAKNLLESGSVNAAYQGSSPTTAFTKPIVQAPTAVTGFAIVYDIDNAAGRPYGALRLDARLLAKLLTESYSSNATMQGEDTALRNPSTSKPNPVDLASDPEFRALNPGVPPTTLSTESASTIMSLSSDSDAIRALTSYINADPEARAWLNGKPDPWGMVVNPKYKGITLPVTAFPLLDTFVPPGLERSANNNCLAQSPVPWLPLVASPVENMATITIDLQFGIANSQINCQNPGALNQTLGAIGREVPGSRFILGIASLADAVRYELNTAALETQGGSTSNATFTTAAGRSFASPTDASLRAAVAMLKPDDKTGSWPVPYSTMRTSPAGKSAYPGTMLMSTDVPTKGLTKTLAHDYSQFLDFVAGPGQAPGVAIGQLPPGFLPMTAANGMARMIAYTNAAAADVAAQNSHVPLPSSALPAVTPARSPSPAPSASRTSSPATSTSPSPAASLIGSGNASLPAVTTSPGTTSNQSAGTTADVHSAVSGSVLPLVLLIALIVGTAAFGAWQLKRPETSP
jgi:ABC-type phosphate transport system substrate-binding protein